MEKVIVDVADLTHVQTSTKVYLLHMKQDFCTRVEHQHAVCEGSEGIKSHAKLN
jgi:hypothetical protein